MPTVNPISVVSFSSEDPNHPASNLLNRETFRKWKTKEGGEKEAFVILKFEKAFQFTAIDIGNEASAMIEVLVGRSGGDGEVKYDVLLCSSILLSPVESRSMKTPCGVKNYTSQHFDKETAAQKWDIVKVQVTQHFNKQTQFGLSFIKFVAAGEKSDKDDAKIGVFAMRKPLTSRDEDDLDLGDEDDEEKDPPRIGALFAKSLLLSKGRNGDGNHNSSPSSSPSASSSTNAAIRSITSQISDAAKSKDEAKVKAALQSGRDSPVSHTSGSVRPTSNKPQGTPSAKDDEEKRKASSSQGSSLKTPATEEEERAERKPFSQLFGDVVFVMSGFQNPYRKNLRDRAIEMGAKCKPDWDSSCTHLICAFINTPKFREVRASGHGKIVRKEWIERSYGIRKRFPWRRYCLDRNDKGEESEDEVVAESEGEEDDGPVREERTEGSTSSGLGTVRRAASADEDEDEEGDEFVPNRQRKRIRVVEEEEEEEENEGPSTTSTFKADPDVYDADTDVDENGSNKDEKETRKDDETKGSADSSTDFEEEGVTPIFQGFVFYLAADLISSGENEKDRIEQIITKRKGKTHPQLTEEVEYILTSKNHWTEDFSEALSDNPNLTVVNKHWVLRSDLQDNLLPCDDFMLTP